jgi:hypothetical protein
VARSGPLDGSVDGIVSFRRAVEVAVEQLHRLTHGVEIRVGIDPHRDVNVRMAGDGPHAAIERAERA